MNDQEVVQVESEVPQVLEDGPSLPSLLSEDFVARFEKGVTLYKRWMSVCYKLTTPDHWVNHGKAGSPKYSLQSPGAEALMNPLGMSFEKPFFKREDVTDENGLFYIYWCEGYVESKALGRRGYYMGYCDSRDPFFNARPGWSPKTGEGDIKKAAFSNWIVNAVTRIAGIRNPDPETLKAAGIDLSKIPSIEYKEGLKKVEVSEGAASKRDEVGKWLMTICNNDKDATKKKLKELTAFNDYKGTDNLAGLSEKQINVLHPKVKKLVDADAPPAEREPGSEG